MKDAIGIKAPLAQVTTSLRYFTPCNFCRLGSHNPVELLVVVIELFR